MSWLLLLAAWAAPDPRVVHGVTVSCPTWGWEWGSDEMLATLDQLGALGVNWIAIHPYASLAPDGRVSFRALDPVPVWLSRPIQQAHARGIQVMIKPHIAHWGSGFSWRGDIDFPLPADRARFFHSYQTWIVALAAATHDADAFVVGTELDKLTGDEDAWRGLITEVRGVSGAHLTYAANWDATERVPFWDALDAVGVQAYYPLGDDLDAGWDRVLGQVRALHRRTGKPVVFTELGYPRALDAAQRPWRHGDDAAGEAVQLAALARALRALEQEPALVGAFLWKWFPGDSLPRDYALQRPAAKEVIGAAWGPSPR